MDKQVKELWAKDNRRKLWEKAVKEVIKRWLKNNDLHANIETMSDSEYVYARISRDGFSMDLDKVIIGKDDSISTFNKNTLNLCITMQNRLGTAGKMIKKPNKGIWEIHLDLETSTFNKVDSNLVHQAKAGGIYELGAILLNPEGERVADKQLFINNGEDMLSTPDNLLFQVKNGLHETYGKAEEDRYLVSLQSADKIMVDWLRDNVEGIEPFKFGNLVQVRLVGKSCLFDLDFLQQKLPKLSRYVSYETLDISAFKNFARKGNSKFFVDTGDVAHHALADAEQTVYQGELIKEFWEKVFTLFPADTLGELNELLGKEIERKGTLAQIESLKKDTEDAFEDIARERDESIDKALEGALKNAVLATQESSNYEEALDAYKAQPHEGGLTFQIDGTELTLGGPAAFGYQVIITYGEGIVDSHIEAVKGHGSVTDFKKAALFLERLGSRLINQGIGTMELVNETLTPNEIRKFMGASL